MVVLHVLYVIFQLSAKNTEPFQYCLSVNIHTVSVDVPEHYGSANAVGLSFESVLLSNKYSVLELSGAGGESYYPLREEVQVDFHQLSIYRYYNKVL